MESFSGVVRLNAVDDFIAPSQACVIPLTAKSAAAASDGAVSLRRRGEAATTAPVKISLNDCLACSGCVTTAEAVLVEQQSGAQLRQAVARRLVAGRAELLVVTVSPQTRASLAAKYGLSVQATADNLFVYLKRLGVDYVLDSNLGRAMSLLALEREFEQKVLHEETAKRKRPLLVSACPGWVCYAEKYRDYDLLPLMSQVRSPQAVMGAIVKDYLAGSHALAASAVYHAAVMPCFDKKLEASRADFVVPNSSVRQVDCVISTGESGLSAISPDARVVPAELDEMMCADQFDMTTARASVGCLSALPGIDGSDLLVEHAGEGSGGFAQAIVSLLQTRLQREGGACSVSRSYKSKDLEEIVIATASASFHVARAYGFRNIQNLVQKLKRGKCNLDFVEVMACPSGCLNGGGQVRHQSLDRLSELHNSIERVEPAEQKCVSDLAAKWLRGFDSDRAASLLHTHFHSVRSLAMSSTLKW